LVTDHKLVFNAVVKYSLQMQQCHLWRNFCLQTNLLLTNEDKILIKTLRLEKGWSVKNGKIPLCNLIKRIDESGKIH